MSFFHVPRLRTRSGFVALITILSMGAVSLTIGVGMLVRAIGEGKQAATTETDQSAHAAATACAEKALMKLKNSLSYAGNETLALTDGSTCRIRALGGSGNTNRTVQTTSTILDVTHKISIAVDRVNSTMSISSWQDVVEF